MHIILKVIRLLFGKMRARQYGKKVARAYVQQTGTYVFPSADYLFDVASQETVVPTQVGTKEWNTYSSEWSEYVSAASDELERLAAANGYVWCDECFTYVLHPHEHEKEIWTAIDKE